MIHSNFMLLLLLRVVDLIQMWLSCSHVKMLVLNLMHWKVFLLVILNIPQAIPDLAYISTPANMGERVSMLVGISAAYVMGFLQMGPIVLVYSW